MFVLFVAVLALAFSAFVMMNQKTNTQEPTAGTANVTTADEGNSLIVVFGTCDLAPNIVGFKAGTPQAIKKKG